MALWNLRSLAPVSACPGGDDRRFLTPGLGGPHGPNRGPSEMGTPDAIQAYQYPGNGGSEQTCYHFQDQL
jgi:hypothetical protein